MRWTFLATMLFLQSSAFAAFEEDMLFLASFDGSLTADRAVGNPKPTRHIGSEFIAGRNHKAVVVNGQKLTFAYETKGNLNPREGTMLFWFNILDWDPNSVQRGEVWLASPPGLLLFHRDLLTFSLWDHGGGGLNAETYGINSNFTRAWWRRNEWHQMAITWDSGESRIYLDDAEAVAKKGATRPPYRFGELLWFGNGAEISTPQYGPHPGIKGSNGRTAIEDFTVYRRPLEREEIRLLFKNGIASKETFGPLVDLVEYVPTAKLNVQVIVRNLPNYVQIKSAQLVVQCEGKDVLRVELPPFVRGRTQTILSTSDVPPGKCIVKCKTFDAAGKMVAESATPLVRHRQPEWVGNSIGKQKVVPWPFESVRYSGGVARCWGREYSYRDSLLPSQITSQGKPMLAGPMTVTAANSKCIWETVRCDKHEPIVQDPTHVTLVAKGQAAGVLLTTKQEIEFDGSVWVTLTVSPGRSDRVAGLAIRMPIRPDVARYLFPAENCKDNAVAAILQDRRICEFSFMPWFYIGTDKIGLQWMTSGARNWVYPSNLLNDSNLSAAVSSDPGSLSRSAKPIQIQLDGDPENPESVTITCRFIGATTTLKEPLTYTFALQAIPYKPLPKQMWFYRRFHAHHLLPPWVAPSTMNETKAQRFNALGNFEATTLSVACSTLGGRDELETPRVASANEAARIKACHAYADKNNLRVMYYYSLHVISPATPEEKECLPEWNTDNMSRVCLKSTYQDYLLHALKRLVDQANIRALYIDNSLVMPCMNTGHGCGYRNADGQIEGEGDLRAEHEFRKRLYVMMYQKWGNDFIIEENSSGYRIGPINAFSTVLLDGECVRLVTLDPKGTPVLDRRGLEQMRYNYNPALWSAPVYWFGNNYLPPDPDQRYTEGPQKAPWELMEGVLRLHGISTDYASGQHYPSVYRLFKAEDLFNLQGNVSFTPWYNAQSVVKTNADLVKISVYRKAARTMLFVANLSDTPLDTAITVDRKLLGLPTGDLRWQDAYHREYYVMHDDSVVKVNMPAFGFRMLMYSAPDLVW